MIVEKVKPSIANIPDPKFRDGSHLLDHQNWVKAVNVRASFNIRHDGSAIYLEYYVKEEQVRAVNSGYNSPVWEDSCVEFFFALEGEDDNYYNFEFNAIGTVLGAYGKNRNERKWLQESSLEQIEVVPSLGRKPIGVIDRFTTWTLWVRIPVTVLSFSQIGDLTGRDGHGNFYKCGDKLKQPHFLSWKPVLSPTPDFHLPRYFGQLSFM